MGNRYYALDLECYEGTFQSRVLLPDNAWGELKADTIPPGTEQSLPWFLSRAEKDILLVDLRPAHSAFSSPQALSGNNTRD